MKANLRKKKEVTAASVTVAMWKEIVEALAKANRHCATFAVAGEENFMLDDMFKAVEMPTTKARIA